MEKLPASAGLQWINQGFALFRKQPAELTALFVCYFFLMIVISIIPVIGTVLSVLTPVLSLALLQGCADVEEGKRVYPHLMLTGFRSPAFGNLVMLGVLHIVALFVAIGATSLFDGGLLWKMMLGKIPADAEVLQKDFPVLMAAYLPFGIGLFFATPLVAWHGMSVGKSVFYSFFTVLKRFGAFFVYILAWWVVVIILAMLLSVIAAVAGTIVASVATMAALCVLMVVMLCSFYCSYAAIFRKPSAPEQLPAP